MLRTSGRVKELWEGMSVDAIGVVVLWGAGLFPCSHQPAQRPKAYVGDTYPNPNSSSHYRNPTLYHVGTVDSLAKYSEGFWLRSLPGERCTLENEA